MYIFYDSAPPPRAGQKYELSLGLREKMKEKGGRGKRKRKKGRKKGRKKWEEGRGKNGNKQNQKCLNKNSGGTLKLTF